MTQSESIVIAENIVDGGDNFCKLLKESKKNGTIEKYLQNQNINRLAFVAAEQDDKDCLKILIDRGVNLSVAVKDNETVLDAIFDKVSDPEKFFNEVLDSKVNLDESSSRRNKVYILDFRLLRPEEDKQMAVISNLCEATSDKTMIKILQHPLFEIYLQLKWSKVVYLFYFWIFLHIISVLCMSAYVTLLTHDIRYHDAALTVICYVMFVIAPTLFLFGVVQTVLINPVRLCKYETWMNLITTILVLVVLGMELCSGYGARLQTGMPSWVLHVASVAILFLWIELMMLIGRLPKYGYYAVMFGVVLKNIVKVLLAFMCLVIGFALSFSIQFYHHHDFTDPWKALVKTVAMMIGEFDYGTIFDTSNNSTTVTVQGGSPTSRVIFLLFVILTSIVLMNLMIGLAVNDIQKLEQEGHARKLQKQAEFLTQIEQIINKMNGKFLSPLATKVVKRFDIGEMVKLDASVKFLKTKKFSSRVRDALFKIVQSKKIKNLQSNDSNENVSVEQ
jgi:transient receptor potential cation channel subfamily A protein 1